MPITTVSNASPDRWPPPCSPDANGAWRPFVVDVDPKDFPWGSYKFVNFTHTQLVGLINKAMFSVAPGNVQMMNPSNSENTRLAIQVKSVKGG
jgi:hypothetical protein